MGPKKLNQADRRSEVASVSQPTMENKRKRVNNNSTNLIKNDIVAVCNSTNSNTVDKHHAIPQVANLSLVQNPKTNSKYNSDNDLQQANDATTQEPGNHCLQFPGQKNDHTSHSNQDSNSVREILQCSLDQFAHVNQIMELPEEYFENLSHHRLFVHLQFKETGHSIAFKVDTGTDVSIIPANYLNADLPYFPIDVKTVVANENHMNINKAITLHVLLPDNTVQPHTFLVTHAITRALLGTDFLSKTQAVIDTNARKLILNNATQLELIHCDKSLAINVHAVETITLMPGEHKMINVKELPEVRTDTAAISIILLPTAVHTHATITATAHVQIQLNNNNDDVAIINKGTRLAVIRQLTHADVMYVQTEKTAKEQQAPTEAELHELIARLDLNLNNFHEDHRQQITTMLRDCYNVFSLHDEIGLAKVAPIDIEFLDTAPVRTQPYKCSEQDSDTIHELVLDLMKQKLVTRASGAWGSPVLLVRRDNKTPRLVVDYRKINKVLVQSNKGFLPSIELLLKRIRPNSYFSTIDLRKAFYNFAITQQSADKLAFVTDRGSFAPSRLPMGLSVSPSECLFGLQQILEGLPTENMIFYVDDLCVHSPDLSTTISSTHLLLQRLQEFGVKVNPDKTRLFVKQIKLLGFQLNDNGVQLPTEYVNKLRHYPSPKTLKELQAFLGLANWAAKFYGHYSEHI